MTLKERLGDWHELDQATFQLALSLGLMAPETRSHLEAKHVFWSANPIGDAVMRMLIELVSLGALERDEEEERVRWNPSFRGTW